MFIICCLIVIIIPSVFSIFVRINGVNVSVSPLADSLPLLNPSAVPVLRVNTSSLAIQLPQFLKHTPDVLGVVDLETPLVILILPFD